MPHRPRSRTYFHKEDDVAIQETVHDVIFSKIDTTDSFSRAHLDVQARRLEALELVPQAKAGDISKLTKLEIWAMLLCYHGVVMEAAKYKKDQLVTALQTNMGSRSTATHSLRNNDYSRDDLERAYMSD